MTRVANTGRTRRTVQGSDLQDRTLGVGDPTSSNASAGKTKARWAKVNLTGGGAAVGTLKEYDIQHDLGETPTLCELKSVENAAVPGTVLKAEESRKAHWSHSHVHMNVLLLAGSFDGCVARFLVQGA